MFQKRGRPYENAAIAKKSRLRENVADLFLSNDISAARAQSLFDDAASADVRSCKSLAAAGNSGRIPKNMSRDLTRKLLKGSQWPKPYVASVRTWNEKTEQEVISQIPILLPHEVVWRMLEDGPTADFLLQHQALGTQDMSHLRGVCEELGIDSSRALGVSLWGDGVPYNYDRSASLDVFSLSLPGLADGRFQNMRIPLFALDHKHVLKGATFDDLMRVLAWSFTHLASGVYPAVRHDGVQFDPKKDRARLKTAGSWVHHCGVLVECRGDWKQLKDVFRFPQFNEKAGMCWLCSCTPETWRNVGVDAPWRAERLDHWGFVARLLRRGLEPSPLFGCPGLSTSCFKPDWLHVVDLGIACDFLGNLLLLVSSKFEGGSHKARVAAMWRHLQGWYRAHGVASPLQHLTSTMLQSSSTQPPKLRAKAAQARALVPYASTVADSRLGGNVIEETAASMAKELVSCYECLSPSAFDHKKLATHCRRFCLLAVAMERHHDGVLWRCKPKLHLFQELAEFHVDCPSLFWTYRDEDFGGSIAQLARKRGGAKTPWAISKSVLDRHCAKHAVPRFSGVQQDSCSLAQEGLLK